MTVSVGQQLGHYHLMRLLGRGAFAEVYLGRHIHLDTLAAVKVLHTELSRREVERFRDEARTMVHLMHPHIVRVLDYGVDETTPFLVMDYAPNGSLRQHHPKGVRLPLAMIVHYVNQVAVALQYAHDQRLVHRDVKPENMLLGRRNELLLSDFGIALLAQATRAPGKLEMAGTVAYMAPEQIQGQTRPASDQYALGIVVYEWLCGDHPFHGSFAEIMAKHAFVPPPLLRELVPDIPIAVEQVVRIALEKNPYKRFVNVQAFSTALQQASGQVQATPPDPSDFPTRIVPAMPPLHQTPDNASLHQSGQPPAIPLPSREPRQAPVASTPSHVPEGSDTYSTVTSSLDEQFATVSLPHHNPIQAHTHATVAPPIPGQSPTMFTPPPATDIDYPHPAILSGSPAQPQAARRKGLRRAILASLVTLVLIGCLIGWATLSQKISFSGSPSVTQTIYPNIAGNFTGPIHNTRANIFALMHLVIKQAQGSLSGTFSVEAPLKGNGSLTGTINTSKHIQFLVRSDTSGQTAAPILFWGDVQPDGSLSGNYCSINQYHHCGDGGYGVWTVTRVLSRSHSSIISP